MGMIFFSLPDFVSSFYKKALKYCSRENIVFSLLCRGDLFIGWSEISGTPLPRSCFSHFLEERMLISHHLDI